ERDVGVEGPGVKRTDREGDRPDGEAPLGREGPDGQEPADRPREEHGGERQPGAHPVGEAAPGGWGRRSRGAVLRFHATSSSRRRSRRRRPRGCASGPGRPSGGGTRWASAARVSYVY